MEPDELSNWWNSPMGKAICNGCELVWPCHYSAWGRADRVSRCNACGGDVHFEFDDDPRVPKVKLDPGYLEMGKNA